MVWEPIDVLFPTRHMPNRRVKEWVGRVVVVLLAPFGPIVILVWMIYEYCEKWWRKSKTEQIKLEAIVANRRAKELQYEEYP